MNMTFNLKDLDKRRVYQLLTHTVTPRPVAWVLTENENKTFNVAPFSYFNIVSSDPALLMFSVGHKRDGDKKDTWANVERTRKCVIHIASSQLMAQVNNTAKPLAFGQSELDGSGLSLVDQADFELPRIGDAAVAYNCELSDLHLIGNGPQAVVYVEAVSAVVDEKLLDESLGVNTKTLDPIARLGGDDYSLLGQIKTLARPT